jgi:hypothetical protein
MESATGLVYIAVAAVLAGTIGAAALYVTSGILIWTPDCGAARHHHAVELRRTNSPSLD